MILLIIIIFKMSNIYCKKCGINKDYYNDINCHRKSCRIKGSNDTWKPNYYHRWDYDYQICMSNLKKKFAVNNNN